MIELATNTITAESRIGSHKAVIGTIVPPGKRRSAPEGPSRTHRAYAWLAELVKPSGDSRTAEREEYSGCTQKPRVHMETQSANRRCGDSWTAWRLCPSDARNGLTRSYRRDSNFLFAHPPRIVGIVCKVLRRIMIPLIAGPYA